jgi:hypothetical protein
MLLVAVICPSRDTTTYSVIGVGVGAGDPIASSIIVCDLIWMLCDLVDCEEEGWLWIRKSAHVQ